MSTPKRQRRDALEAAAAAASITALSDEVLVRALSFVDKRGVGAAASACRRWHAVVHGEASAPLWRGLVAAHHPSLLLEAASRVKTSSGWRDLFLRTQRLAALAADRLHGGLERHVKRIEEDDVELFGSHAFRCQCDLSVVPHCRGRRCLRRPYPPPTKGTTATATPYANGVFPQPVYYDWGANWDRVSALVPTKPVQAALKLSVDEAEDGYYFDSWDEGKVWPFLFNIHRRIGNGEESDLMRKFLPREHVLEMNGRVAKWFRARGEVLLSSWEYDPTGLAEAWAEHELKSGIEASEDEWAEDLVREMVTNELDLDLIHEEGHDLMLDIEKSSEAVLYNKDSPLRETLLCTPQNTWAFMPLNYALAARLSPKDAELKVYASEDYSVVVDERRNIVFDNYWYFYGKSASRALKESRDGPQLEPSEFDYSLGGLAN